LTGEEELNMIVSLYANSVGVPQVITKLGHIANQSIIDTLNLGSVVCPKDLVSNNIVRYVRAMQNQTGAAVSMHTIADGQAEAMEFRVDEHAQNCGKPLKEIRLKQGVLLVSISHGAATEIPYGDSMFQQGDTVVVVTNGREIIKNFNDIFA
jgi:trk system potassium uptake protein TrkA